MSNDDKQGCLATIRQLLGLSSAATDKETPRYRVRDDFLSAAERSFYHVLRASTGDWAVICPKVSLQDLFFAQSGDHDTNVGLLNRIARKHIDFLLCEPGSMRPLLGIELDDASHERASRQERDRLVQQVFDVAGLPLVRVQVEQAYDTRALKARLQDTILSPRPTQATAPVDPTQGSVTAGTSPPVCPRCGVAMVLRTAQRGAQAGQQFYGCVNYPRCHQTLPFVEPKATASL